MGEDAAVRKAYGTARTCTDGYREVRRTPWARAGVWVGIETGYGLLYPKNCNQCLGLSAGALTPKGRREWDAVGHAVLAGSGSWVEQA